MPQEEEHGHTIGVVTRRTGLTAHVIRVWERRYGAVQPLRTATNRRLYSDGDIERLRLLQRATKAGHGIGQIATLPLERLNGLLRQDEPATNPTPPRESRAPHEYVETCMELVEGLDAAGLERALSQAAIDLSQQMLLEEVVDPLMNRVGEAWQTGALRIADEHLASAVVRSFLASLQDMRRGGVTGPGIIVTTPAGQVHEVGAMMVAATASTAGWRTAYLGPDLPADEICGAARRHGASCVALSLVYPLNDPQIPRELRRLRRGLGDDFDILAGGRATPGYIAALHEIDARIMTDLGNLRQQLSLSGHPTATTGQVPFSVETHRLV